MNIALNNATVVPCTGDQPIESGTVLVEGERIAWVGPSADAPENGSEQIDCTGKTSDDCNCLCHCAGVDAPCSHPENPCVVSVTCTPRATPC